MNAQPALWHDSLSEALHDVIYALGGPKAVGAQLWPSKDPQDAGRQLSKCVDAERAEKLSLEEVEWLVRKSSEAGVHIAMAYLCRIGHYADPKPIDPQDERAELQREFNHGVKELAALAKRLEAM